MSVFLTKNYTCKTNHRSVRSYFPRSTSRKDQFISTRGDMQWKVSISFNFIRLAIVSVLTYLLRLLSSKPSSSIAVCHPRNRRRRRNRRRTVNTQHVNVDGMQQLVRQVAAQCPRPRTASRSPEPPAYQQVYPRSRTQSRSPPRTCRCSDIFYLE